MRWLAVVPALIGLELLSMQSGAADAPGVTPAKPARAISAPAGSATPPPPPTGKAKPDGPPTASEPTPSPAPPAAATTPPAASGSEPQPTAPPPPNGPPPQYYVEPQASDGNSAASTAGGFTAESAYEPPEPPPPIYEPMPPPRADADGRVPRTALWLGARVGWLIPFGSLWLDGFGGGSGLAYRRRTFGSYASPGPLGEIDIGARLARRYMVFAVFEHGSFGSGNLDDKSFGGQNRGATNFYGVGLRFSTDPGSVGFAMEIALGYRDFRAYWSDGTELAMTNGFLDARLGLGVDIRVNRWFSLSPMVVLGGGSFGSARWSGPGGTHDAQTSLDQNGEYGTFALELGGHFDVH